MAANTRLGIEDYLKRTGIGRQRLRQAQAPSALSPSRNSSGDFAQLLDGLQPAAQVPAKPASGRLQLNDYRQRPVRLRSITVPAATQKLPEISSRAADGPWLLADTPPAATPPKEIGTPVDYQINPPPDGPAVGPQPAPEPAPAELPLAERIAAGIRVAADKYDLPPALIHSVIRAESNFQPDAVSPAGAQDLMQLMPATAEELGVEDPFNIEQNIDGGARYLRRMLDLFSGNLHQALSAYNAGPGAVMRHNGQVPYAETRNYVQKVLAYSQQPRQRLVPSKV